jgi:hypothetical protein
MAKSTGAGIAGFIEYPTTPLLLERTPKRHNILIGNDAAQMRFAEQFLTIAHSITLPGVKHELVEVVNDGMLLGQDDPKLYVVERSSLIDISPNVKNKTGIFSLDLIEKGSAGINAIVREGGRLLGLEKLEKAVVDRVGNEVIKDSDPKGKRYLIGDIRSAIWQAAWELTGPATKRPTWSQPWENWMLWLPKGVDPRYRLNTLYWTLVMWTFAQSADERGYRKTKGRWDAKQFSKLGLLQLPKDKVYNTLVELSAWKERKYDPYVCALKIAKIWETQ